MKFLLAILILIGTDLYASPASDSAGVLSNPQPAVIVAPVELTVTVQRVESANLSFSLTDRLPDKTANWQPVKLPYFLNYRGTASAGEFIWFEFPLVVEAVPEGSLGFFLARHMRNINMYVNGKRVFSGRRHGNKSYHGWNTPILVEVQTANLRTGSNIVTIGLRKGILHTNLGNLFVGDYSQLESVWEEAYFFQVQTALLSMVACIIMAILTFGLWLKRQESTEYLFFTGGCLAWAIVMLYLYLPYPVIDAEIWVLVGYVAVDTAGLCLAVFINRAMGFNLQKLESGLVVYVAAGSLALFSLPLGFAFYIAIAMHLGVLGALLYLCSRSLILFFKTPEKAPLWIGVSILVLAAFLIHDIYIFWQSAQYKTAISSYTYMQFSIPCVLLILFVYIINQFGAALNEAETLNVELESRIRTAKEKLEQSFAENRQFELNENANQERQKIYRDLHDDVGSKLASIIHTSAEQDQRSLARSALESLRQAIHRANYQTQSLQDLLALVKDEMSLRFSSAGIHFTILEDLVVPDYPLVADRSYHLTRIFREITSNILNHAAATEVSFLTQINEEGQKTELIVEVSDNGIGFDPAMGFGNGIANIRFRAESIGASVDWLSAQNPSDKQQGCTFTVCFPLDVTAQA